MSDVNDQIKNPIAVSSKETGTRRSFFRKKINPPVSDKKTPFTGTGYYSTDGINRIPIKDEESLLLGMSEFSSAVIDLRKSFETKKVVTK